jgi:uncharacterized protein YydD (DUF2326 family)
MPNSITYKEHFNIGNYSWKEFERTIILSDGDDVEQRTLELIDFVKRMIGYQESKEELDRLQARIEELKTERKELLKQIKELNSNKSLTLDTPDSEPESDDIPFDNSNF